MIKPMTVKMDYGQYSDYMRSIGLQEGGEESMKTFGPGWWKWAKSSNYISRYKPEDGLIFVWTEAKPVFHHPGMVEFTSVESFSIYSDKSINAFKIRINQAMENAKNALRLERLKKIEEL